jgi:hypothetical protein
MPRYNEEKSEKSEKGDSVNSKFIEKKQPTYKTRYKGDLAPEKDIVEDYTPGNYKDNRYK